MTEKMLQFVGRNRETPAKRSAGARKQDFEEIYAIFAREKAAQQSARCSQCGVPFCQNHCPLGNNIPDWLRLTAEGRLREAYEASAETNLMPEICGRICPQDRLCEGACVIEQSGHGTVTIGAVEQYLTETAFSNGWVGDISPAQSRAESVGIVGAGPAGLAAADVLRRNGFNVVIYDRYDRAGGLLIYGIPNFKLEKGVVQRRTKRLTEGGVEFRFGVELGRNVTLEELRMRHDAVFLAFGVYSAGTLNCDGATLKGVIPALDFLTASNRKGLGDVLPEADHTRFDAAGKKVVVIGGGDTAMDCVRTSVRQGAQSVTCLYRRDRRNMPGSLRETLHAEEEGVIFEWLAAPKEILGGGDGCVRAVRAYRMELGERDSGGRRLPVPVAGSEFIVDADLVIAALGFSPVERSVLFPGEAPEMTKRGTIMADAFGRTSIPRVYAGGDIVRGASLVVWAVKDGRDAGKTMIADATSWKRLAAE